jgi:hypothetical protein
MSTIGVELKIAGIPIPIDSYSVSGSSSGSTGHMQANTGMARLEAAGIDLVEMAVKSPTALPLDIFLTEDDAVTQIFSGEYLSAGFDYAATSVSIHARDWSGPLVDQRRVLVSILGGNAGSLAPSEDKTDGVETQNQKVSQIVTAIAKQFSLIPDLRLAKGSDPDIGTIFGTSSDTILTTTPQSLWSILNRIARDTGNIVYTTPQKHLVFGEPGAGLQTIPITWKVNPIPDGSFGAMNLSIDHNPRRNSSFQVIVLSYDPTDSKVTTGRSYVIGSNFATNDKATVRPGLWSGQQAQSILNATKTTSDTESKDKKNNKIPIYTFHVDGLTQAQADQRAQAIALDISKRELIANAKIRCLPSVQPATPVSLAGQINQEFASHKYFVTEYSHHYKLTAGSNTGEFHTMLKMLDRQPIGDGESVTTAMD